MEDFANSIISPENGFRYDATIKIIGVGGAGSNAVNYMKRHKNIEGVHYIVCNTDYQALMASPVDHKIQIGKNRTSGRGAGNNPKVGQECALEAQEEIKEALEGTKLLFITAGMGGGTGTGAAPVVAEIAQGLDILTVGVVIIPFEREGPGRIASAIRGIENFQKKVDAIVILHSDRIYRGNEADADEDWDDALNRINDVLANAVKGAAEMITRYGDVNIDFEDLKTAMKNSGCCLIGYAEEDGPDRAMKAVKKALDSEILFNDDIRGASYVLYNLVTTSNKESGHKLKTKEVFDVQNYLDKVINGDEKRFDMNDGTLIWGSGFDDSLDDKIRVTIVATGYSPDVFIRSGRKAIERTGHFDDNGNFVQETMQPLPVDDMYATEIESNQMEINTTEAISKKYDILYGNSHEKTKQYEPKQFKQATTLDLSLEHNLEEIEKPAYLRLQVK